MVSCFVVHTVFEPFRKVIVDAIILLFRLLFLRFEYHSIRYSFIVI